MRNWIIQFSALPTWMLATIVLYFITEHPWKKGGRFAISLEQWALDRTLFTKTLDILVAVAILAWIYFVARLL